MKKASSLLIMFFILISFAGCRVKASASPQSVPTLSFECDGAVISLGMTKDETEKLLGKPDSKEDSPMAFCTYDGISISYVDDTVAAIKLQEDSQWETAEGIGMGSNKDELLAVYPFDMNGNGLNGVYSLTCTIEKGEISVISWDEFGSWDTPENAFYLTVNVDNSDKVYDVVLRDKRFVLSAAPASINANSKDYLGELKQSIQYEKSSGTLSISIPKSQENYNLSITVTGRLFDHEDSMKMTWSPFKEAVSDGWEEGKTYTGCVQLANVDYIEIAAEWKDSNNILVDSFAVLINQDGDITPCEKLPPVGERDVYYQKVLTGKGNEAKI